MSFCVARVDPDAACRRERGREQRDGCEQQSHGRCAAHRSNSKSTRWAPFFLAAPTLFLAAATMTSPRAPRYVFVPPVMTIVNPDVVEVDRPGGHERAPGLELVVRLAEGVLVVVEVAGVHARARVSLQRRVAVQAHGVDGDVACERPVPAAGALRRQLVGRAVERVVDVPARRVVGGVDVLQPGGDAVHRQHPAWPTPGSAVVPAPATETDASTSPTTATRTAALRPGVGARTALSLRLLIR